MLAVVENQQRLAPGQVLGQAFERRASPRIANGHHGKDSGGDGVGFDHRCQLDPPHLAVEIVGPLIGKRRRQTRLAAAAGPDERDQAIAAEQRSAMRQLVGAAHQ